jgi:hypothetical protein
MLQSRHDGPLLLFTIFVVSLHLLARCGLEIPKRYPTMVYLYTLPALTSVISMINFFSEIGSRFRTPSLSEQFKASGHLLFWLLTIGVTYLPEEHSHVCMVLFRSYCVFYITKWLCKKLDSVLVLVYSVLLYCTQYHYQYIVLILALHKVTFMFRLNMPNEQHWIWRGNIKEWDQYEKEKFGFCIDITLLMFVWYLRGQDGVSETDPFLNFLIPMKHFIDRIITIRAFFNCTTFEMDKWKIEWSCIHAILLGFISVLYYCSVDSL